MYRIPAGKTKSEVKRLGSRFNSDPNQQGGLRLVPLCPWFLVSSFVNEEFRFICAMKSQISPLEIQFAGPLELFMGVQQVSAD